MNHELEETVTTFGTPKSSTCRPASSIRVRTLIWHFCFVYLFQNKLNNLPKKYINKFVNFFEFVNFFFSIFFL